MVGKPLALDKNYLRNFSYIRVKIGCQDITMVPSTRIGEIKKAFFEFQFTREMPEASAQPNNQDGVTVDNVVVAEQQGTPKRQRILNLDNGSHSAPPRAPGGNNDQQGRQMSNDDDSERRRKRMGKDLLPEFAQSTAQKIPTTTCANDSGSLLQPVHREVVESLAANAASGSGSGPETSIPVSDDQSFSKFVQDLTKSGSDKCLYIQKKYKQFMEPLVENSAAEEEDPSSERVNLEGSESEEESTDQSAGMMGMAM
jgi:hypothetical protein